MAMARFRFARGTLPDGYPATDVVKTRAELVGAIQRNIVYLRDLTEPNPLIIPPPPGARLVVSPDEPLYRPDPGLLHYRISRRTVNVGGTVELLCVIDLRAAI
jgi:hypothetical protein